MALIRLPRARLWTLQGDPYTHDLLIRTDFITNAYVETTDPTADAPERVDVYFGSGESWSFRSDDGEDILGRLEV